MINFKRSPYLRPAAEYTKRTRTDYLVVHCADTPATMDIGAEKIREWHVNERGWLDIGYHYVIRRDGTIENGRPPWAVGAGVAGYNGNSLHVCLVGGDAGPGRRDEHNFSAEQMAALALLLGMLKKYVAPSAKILGHRDFPNVAKSCPSFDVRKWLGEPSVSVALAAGFAFDQVQHGKAFLN